MHLPSTTYILESCISEKEFSEIMTRYQVRTNEIYDWYSLVEFSNILFVVENIDKVSYLMFTNLSSCE